MHIYAHTYIHTYAHMWAHTHTHTHTNTHVRTCDSQKQNIPEIIHFPDLVLIIPRKDTF